MNLFQYVNINLIRIKSDVKNGLIPCSIIKYFAIYSRFDYYRKLGYNCSDSVFATSQDHNVNERTVFRIIKKMETEI